MANLSIYVNIGTLDAPLGNTGTEFIEFSSGNDIIIFTAGNNNVKDGADIPTQQELISAGIDLSSVVLPYTIETYLLQDTGANLLRDIDLMGDLNSRYVLAFDFDDTTASEPVFEVWDDSNFDSISSVILGSGTPSQSFVRGITTTDASAGSPGWVGSRLAGSSSGNFLFLNNQNGALVGADTLYATLKLIIPSGQTTGFSANPVFVVKWLDN